jgi:hypothetical protein
MKRQVSFSQFLIIIGLKNQKQNERKRYIHYLSAFQYLGMHVATVGKVPQKFLLGLGNTKKQESSRVRDYAAKSQLGKDNVQNYLPC